MFKKVKIPFYFQIIFIFLLIVQISSCTCISVNIPIFPEEKPLREYKISGEGKYKILLVDISGIILSGEAESFTSLIKKKNMAKYIREVLDKAKKDKKVKAVVLKINSPGGTVTASDLVYREILKFKKETGIPVYAAMLDLATSGALYLAMACDKVYASPTTITGSIGVIFQNIDLTGLLDKIGIKDRTVKSGDKKDMGSPLRKMTDEEIAIMKEITLEMYNKFINVIADSRKKMSREDILKLADGRILSSKKALENGLIDGIEYLDDVLEEAKKNAGLKEAKVVTYNRPGAYEPNIYSMPSGGYGSKDILKLLKEEILHLSTSSGFMYIWKYGADIH
ncbi:MAG: signal peptide peptidase SppA [Candidatus Schekmanbacteria bacterium]|nr:MAG: signal peptide peptidase SppA [Candidatus Schekmanbacteria bacterium]